MRLSQKWKSQSSNTDPAWVAAWPQFNTIKFKCLHHTVNRQGTTPPSMLFTTWRCPAWLRATPADNLEDALPAFVSHLWIRQYNRSLYLWALLKTQLLTVTRVCPKNVSRHRVSGFSANKPLSTHNRHIQKFLRVQVYRLPFHHGEKPVI